MTYTPTNPYTTEVEVKAWEEGLTMASSNAPDDERNELNPYTAGDTCVAWAQGFDDGRYNPVPIDWSNVDLDDPAITQRVFQDKGDVAVGDKTTYLMLVYSPYSSRLTADEKPDWADNRWQDRSIKLTSEYQRNAMFIAIRQQPAGTIDLPCPPYEYEVNGNELSIRAGAYHKTGSKQEWENVIAEMQSEVDAMPDGIDVGDVSISIDVQARATATWSTQVSASTLLDQHEQFREDVWAGTMDELVDALEEAVGELDGSELESEYAEVEYEIDFYDDVDVETSDITYDLSDANEL